MRIWPERVGGVYKFSLVIQETTNEDVLQAVISQATVFHKDP